MSWALGNKRWTLPFMSLNGMECRVDIYKKGYTGSEVTTLTGAAVPIRWDEDDDEDLLNVVRVKTGELNVIEMNYGDLRELYPSLSNDHYIEVYYGEIIEYDEDDGSIISREDRLIFVGFMQAQTFENEWVSGPRTLSFNIMSPLGLADGLMFNKPTTPSFKSLGTLLREIIDGLNANIGFVVFPDPDSNGSMKTYCMFHMLLCSNVVTPEDGPYKYNLTTADLFSQRSYREFLEGLCNCFGMMVHDNINVGQIQLVFSRFDYTGKYSWTSRYQLADGQSRSHISVDGNTESDLATATSVSADDNTESLILPLNKIDITYDGGFFKSASLPFDRCSRYAGGGTGLSGWQMAYNIPINGELTSDKLISNPFLNSNGRLSSPGVVFAGVGQDSPEEMVLIQKGTGWETGVPVIFKWTLYERPWQSFHISFNGKYGSSIANLDNPDDGDATIHLFIKCGNRYYTNSGWGTTVNSYNTAFGDHTIAVSDLSTIGRGYPLEIWMTIDLQYLNADYIYTIQKFKVERGTGEFYEYVYGENGSDERTIDGDVSEVSGSVDCLFSDQALTNNLLSAIGGNASVGYPENPYYSAYRYLIVSQNRLQVRVKGTVPDYAYILKTIYFNTGWRWRIIAIGFNPIDDEYTITMHRSSTIE